MDGFASGAPDEWREDATGTNGILDLNPNGGGPYRQAHGRHRPSTISSHSKGATNG